jgi:hypothetical protein
MSAIEMLREALEKSGYKVLSLQQRSQKFKNNHTGEGVEVVFEYEIKDGVDNSACVYVLDGGKTWQVNLFHAHHTAA